MTEHTFSQLNFQTMIIKLLETFYSTLYVVDKTVFVLKQLGLNWLYKQQGKKKLIIIIIIIIIIIVIINLNHNLKHMVFRVNHLNIAYIYCTS